jgi:hypothetical protein
MTFSWNESEWIRRERRDDSIEFAGGSPITLSLSHYGRELAVGRPYFPADLSGQIQTFEFPRTNCDEGFERFRITVTIQPTVTRWNLTSLTQDASFESTGGGPCFFPNFPGAANVAVTHRDGATVVEELCVPEQQCGNFTLYPPGFGGAAFLLNQETRVVEWENDDVLNRWIGTVDPSAMHLWKRPGERNGP